MAWTTPTVRATSDLITASIWNTDIVDNLKYLKGQTGTISLEGNPVPSAATKTVGTSALPWGEGHFYQNFAGPRYATHRFVREVVIHFEDDTGANYNFDIASGGAGGDFSLGGTGQGRLKVDEDQAGQVYIANLAEQNNAFDTSFNVARNPYIRVEFAINNNDAVTEAFIGLRDTPGVARPLPAAEDYAGFQWTGAIWVFENGDGAGNQDTSGSQTVTVNTRYVIEIYINSGVSVEYWKNGTLIKTSVTALPDGDLEWTVLLKSVGGGGAGLDVNLTVGAIFLQEDLS